MTDWYRQALAALRAPINPTELVGIWWPDGDKFIRVEFALRGGQLQTRAFAPQGRGTSLPTGEWVAVKITGNQIEIDNANFRNSISTSTDYDNDETDFDLKRIDANRLIGEVDFAGKMLKDGAEVWNRGTNVCEWRRRK